MVVVLLVRENFPQKGPSFFFRFRNHSHVPRSFHFFGLKKNRLFLLFHGSNLNHPNSTLVISGKVTKIVAKSGKIGSGRCAGNIGEFPGGGEG